MSKLLAEIMDCGALYLFHRNKSRTPHFNNTGCTPPIEKHQLFYFTPQKPELIFDPPKNHGAYKTGKFKYKSKIDNDLCNAYATGTFHEHSLDTPLNVVLVHGWRQGPERIQAIYLKPLMEQNYNMYYYTLPFHSERKGNNSSYNGELMISTNMYRTLSSIRQAVVDLRALIKWLKVNSNGKIVLIGISLGGLVVNLTTAVEEDFDGSISVFAPTELSYVIWNNIPGKYIKQEFEEHGLTYPQLKANWDIINPSNFTAKLPREKMLILSALYDKYIDFKDNNTLWEAWDRPERKLYHCGHAGIALCKNRIAKDSLDFINRNVLYTK